jgi:Transposase
VERPLSLEQLTLLLQRPGPRAIYRCRDRDQAAARLYDWTIVCIDSGVAELTRLARTITTWRDEFLAYFTTSRISNGPTEAVNLLIKKILRVGHGFRNFRQLSATPAVALRDHLPPSNPDTTTWPPTTFGCVEPLILGGREHDERA